MPYLQYHIFENQPLSFHNRCIIPFYHSNCFSADIPTKRAPGIRGVWPLHLPPGTMRPKKKGSSGEIVNGPASVCVS